MTSPKQISRAFSQLLFAALADPATVDKNELLTAASAFLEATLKGGAYFFLPGINAMRYLAALD
jgi:hypothetical protein